MKTSKLVSVEITPAEIPISELRTSSDLDAPVSVVSGIRVTVRTSVTYRGDGQPEQSGEDEFINRFLTGEQANQVAAFLGAQELYSEGDQLVSCLVTPIPAFEGDGVIAAREAGVTVSVGVRKPILVNGQSQGWTPIHRGCIELSSQQIQAVTMFLAQLGVSFS
jgi:hypothetical protein